MLVTQSCPTLYNSMDCSPPGSSVTEFSRQDHWNSLPFPPPGDLPDPGIEPGAPTLWVDSLAPESCFCRGKRFPCAFLGSLSRKLLAWSTFMGTWEHLAQKPRTWVQVTAVDTLTWPDFSLGFLKKSPDPPALEGHHGLK